MVTILADVIVDDKTNKLNKFKIISDYITKSIEPDSAPQITTLRLEMVDIETVREQKRLESENKQN